MITNELPKELNATLKSKTTAPSPLNGWLHELEANRAKEFQRRTGLDYQDLLHQIIAAADLKPGMQVLELAAATGAIARHLVGMVGAEGKIVGVDTSQQLVEQARLDAQSAQVGSRIEWRVAPLNHLPFNDNRFDVVTCGAAFNQLNATEFFRETARVLKLQGVLLVAAELAPQAGLSDFVQKARQQYYRLVKRNSLEASRHFYSATELSDMLRTAGFRQIVIRGMKSQLGYTARSFSLIRAIK